MPNNEKLDICNKALLNAAGVKNPKPQYAEKVMTSSANDEWNQYELIMAVHLIYKTIRLLEKAPDNEKVSCALDINSLQHAIDFIEYNMRMMDITGGNGD